MSGHAPSINVDDIVQQVTAKVTANIQTKIQDALQSALSHNTQSSATLVTQPVSATQVTTSTYADVPINTVSAQHISSATIQPSTGTGSDSLNSKMFQSASLPLHSFIPMKIKEKIWNSEFLDFSTAFNDPEDTEKTISLSFDSSGGTKFVQKPKRKFITIEQWTDYFAKFSSVLRIKHPELADSLAQYSATVRSIAKSRGNWHFYDTQFRKLKQNVDIPWDVIQHELYFKALNQKQLPFRSGQGSAQKPFAQVKSCNKFNSGEHCDGCEYPHICRLCGGKHPRFRCYKRNQTPQPSGSSNTGNQQNSQSSAGNCSTLSKPRKSNTKQSNSK
ncbi:MAG: hypothetical protein AB2693_27560 [Candidatus Thiodiazotropha sp.]